MIGKMKQLLKLIITAILIQIVFVNISNAQEEEVDAIILGGGICGISSALRLAEAGFKVIVVEQLDSLLSGSSDRSVYRMGLGFHYIGEIDTARKIFETTLSFAKKYQGYTVDKKIAGSNFLSYGRYFLLKDSINKGFITQEKFFQELNLLKQYYAELVQQDATNQVFGLPQNLYRILKPEEYTNEVKDINEIATAIEVKEYILDWPKFKNYILNKVAASPKIKVLTNFEVIDAVKNPKGDGYCITATNKQQKVIKCSPYIINSLWENIESLNKKVGLSDGNEKRTNRLKLLAEVELPNSLKNKSSMFFFKGPYGMFVNKGNGKGCFTYAHITNYKNSTDIEVPTEFKRIMKGLTKDEEIHLASKMLEGISKFIPQMKYAKVENIVAGIVKSKGFSDIDDPKSEMHKRSDSGVEVKAKGWIDNSCMKFFSCEHNAAQILEIIQSTN